MKNGLKTAALLGLLGGFFILVGGAIGGSSGLVIGLVIGLLLCGGTYWFSDKLAIASARAKPVTQEESPLLYAMVSDLAQKAQMPMPRLYLSPEQQPNAFATGRNPKHAVVCVTQGILDVLLARSTLGPVGVLTDVRPLHEQHVDVARRVAEQLREDGRLSPVGTDVPRVKKPPAVRLDEEGIGVEGAVVVQVGRDGERANRERLPVTQEPGGLQVAAEW